MGRFFAWEVNASAAVRIVPLQMHMAVRPVCGGGTAPFRYGTRAAQLPQPARPQLDSHTAVDPPQQPDRCAPGLLDRDYGRDVLAVPCLRGSGDAYVCPACRTSPGGQERGRPNCAQATGPV